MTTFELILSLLFAGSLLVYLAGQLNVPYPAFLAVAGVVLAFVPRVPVVALDPRLTMALFVAPVLVSAAYDTSLRDLRDNWRPVAALSIVVVCLTTFAVALVARTVVPGLCWPLAVALGAIVAPPDAAAAIAVLAPLRPPHRLQVVLEGESLLNDATSLLIWRLALTAAASGGLSWRQAVPAFLLTAVGGVVAGYAMAWLYLKLTARMRDVTISVMLQFLATFLVWLLADRLGLSAIVTMVVYAITIARSAPYRQSPRARITSNSVWDVVVLTLSILAFIMMGLQMRDILHRVGGHAAQFAGFAAAVCGTVILTRIIWVSGYNAAVQWKNRRFGVHVRRPMMLPSWASGVVVAWCGMRGIVTLATALALPEQLGGGGVPYRDLLVFAAFCVVLTTLVLQGLTLPALLRALGLTGDDTVGGEIRLARAATARAALETLDGEAPPEATLRREYHARLRRADAADASVAPPHLARTRQRALAAERRALAQLRLAETIGDAAFHRIEEELDWAEVDTESRADES